ncbi:MAG: hypothetical protein ACREJ2_01215 [Planctomycetota bacterium]
MVLQYRKLALGFVGVQALLAVLCAVSIAIGAIDMYVGLRIWLPIWFTFQAMASATLWHMIRIDSLYDCDPEITQVRVYKFMLAGLMAIVYGFPTAAILLTHGPSATPGFLFLLMGSFLTVGGLVFVYLSHRHMPPHVRPAPRPTANEVRRQIVATHRREGLGDIRDPAVFAPVEARPAQAPARFHPVNKPLPLEF